MQIIIQNGCPSCFLLIIPLNLYKNKKYCILASIHRDVNSLPIFSDLFLNVLSGSGLQFCFLFLIFSKQNVKFACKQNVKTISNIKSIYTVKCQKRKNIHEKMRQKRKKIIFVKVQPMVQLIFHNTKNAVFH